MTRLALRDQDAIYDELEEMIQRRKSVFTSMTCEIRAARGSGESFGSLSKRYGLSIGHVFRIVTRKAWSHRRALR